MMIFTRFQGDEDRQPIETWTTSRGLDGIRYPSIKDSRGDYFGLATHSISNEGVVSPSVVCPYGCGFHEFVTLKGWDQIKGRKQV